MFTADRKQTQESAHVSNSKRMAERWLSIAGNSYKKQKFDLALRYYQFGLDNDLDNYDLIEGKARSLLKLNRFRDSLEYFESVLKIIKQENKYSKTATHSAVNTATATASNSASTFISDSASAANPGNHSAVPVKDSGELARNRKLQMILYYKGIVCLRLGFYDLTLKCCDFVLAANKILEAYPWHDASAVYEAVYQDKADAHFYLGEYKKAIGCYKLAMKQMTVNNHTAADYPNKIRCQYAIGIAHLQLKDYERAIYFFNQVTKAKPSHLKSHYYKGIAYSCRQNFAEALNSFEQSILCNHLSLRSWHNKGVMHLCLNDPSSALTSFEQALKLDREYKPAMQGKEECLRLLVNQKLEKETVMVVNSNSQIKSSAASRNGVNGVCAVNEENAINIASPASVASTSSVASPASVASTSRAVCIASTSSAVSMANTASVILSQPLYLQPSDRISAFSPRKAARSLTIAGQNGTIHQNDTTRTVIAARA